MRLAISLVAAACFGLVGVLQWGAGLDPAPVSPRVPDGWEVVDVEPPPWRAAQPAGPAREAGWAWRVRDPVTGMRFVLVEPGEFVMGAAPDADEAKEHERPQRVVRITRPLYVGETEVTEEQWRRVVDDWAGPSSGVKRPVEGVSWYDAQLFVEALNRDLGIGCRGDDFCRLPKEAEWEYVCRAGTTTPWSTGARLDADRADFAASTDDSRGGPLPVRTFAPNPWGIHGMHGGVSEWCQDRFTNEPYPPGYQADPLTQGPASIEVPCDREERVARGGDWYSGAERCRSSSRIGWAAGRRRPGFGLRVVRTVESRKPTDPSRLEFRPRRWAWETRLEELEKDYGIEVVTGHFEALLGGYPGVRSTPAEVLDLLNASTILDEEIRRYPRRVFRLDMETAEIVLCKDLVLNGEEESGLQGGHRIYLRVRAEDRPDLPLYIHHEIFHYLDGTMHQESSFDDAWSALNHAEFHYGELAPNDSVYQCPGGSGGFVTRYARTDPGEDKAETFSYLVNHPWYVGVSVRRDPVLAAKVALLRERFRDLDTSRLFPPRAP